jgi:hypothetical protein
MVVLKLSDDGTESLVNSFRRRGTLNIRSLKQKKKICYGALNLGMKSVEGKIVAFLEDARAKIHFYPNLATA